MFTVCPKCALTLVVTAADLRIAQGYVRCGRCSNVFNAIVGLSEDRSGGASSTATTSTIRKAPAISDDEPPGDVLSDTGETEAIYAEPDLEDREEQSLQEVFVEAPMPTRQGAPAKSPPRSPASPPAARSTPPASAPGGGASRPSPSATPGASRPAPSATPGASPSRPVQSAPPSAPAPIPAAPSAAAARPSPAPAPPAGARPTTSPQTSGPSSAAKPRSPASAPTPPPPSPPEFTDSIPDIALEFNPEATDVTQVFVEAAPAKKIDLRQVTGTFEKLTPKPDAQPARPPSPPPSPPPPPRRDPEDIEIDDELRSLAARLDATGQQPAQKPVAAKPSRPGTGASSATKSSGSPYNSADTATSAQRKPSAAATRRGGASASGTVRAVDPDAEFDAPTADELESSMAVGLTRRPMSLGKKLAWIAGSVVLLLGLAAQYVHQNRHDLAASASLNRPLTRLYAALGVPLVPRWNPASFEVRQLGAFSADADQGNLTVRASLKNAAEQPLPLPLLRITVQDRYGNRIATRDVPPTGYVPGAVPEGARLGAGQRIDAEMSFKDPGRDAVGFEIDACLPTPEGRVACANDTAPVAAR